MELRDHEREKLPPIQEIISNKNRIKILIILAKKGQMKVPEIARLAEISYGTCSKNLKELAHLNILQEKKFQRNRIYRFRIENIKIRALKNLFDLWDSERF